MILARLSALSARLSIGMGSALSRRSNARTPSLYDTFTNHLVNGAGAPLGPEEFFAPGSILQIRVDTSNPLAYGLNERTDISFQRTSPVLRLKPDADKAGVTQIGWFDDDDALRSGWAWGQDKLFGGTAIASAKVGDGDLHMLAPEILFRGQAHGTFQLLFNGIYLANATQVQLGDL